jgi:NAD-dependent deacetylase
MEKVIIFSGSGISAESGIRTFRDSGGLWEEYDIYEVATPEAWQRDPELVTNFYNARRRQIMESAPNPAHYAIAELELRYDVTVVTQNIDDLHERAGSTDVLHLHGEIMKARSTADANLIYPVKGADLTLNDRCEKGSVLRPHIVWFGEMVPMLEPAAQLTMKADIFIVIGTSLEVYPAASLVNLPPAASRKYYIDPGAPERISGYRVIREKAGIAMPELSKQLLDKS